MTRDCHSCGHFLEICGLRVGFESRLADELFTFRIAIGADHGAVDYSDYANLVARTVADGTYDFGILACTSGVGMSIAANRHRHVRSVEETVTTREHNDSNVLCLSGKFTDEATAIAMADDYRSLLSAGGP